MLFVIFVILLGAGIWAVVAQDDVSILLHTGIGYVRVCSLVGRY